MKNDNFEKNSFRHIVDGFAKEKENFDRESSFISVSFGEPPKSKSTEPEDSSVALLTVESRVKVNIHFSTQSPIDLFHFSNRIIYIF